MPKITKLRLHLLKLLFKKTIGFFFSWHGVDSILVEKKLCWLWHVIRMDHQHIPRQTLNWEVPGFKRGPGRPRTNWRSTVTKDVLKMETTWEEAEMAAQSRPGWHLECGALDASCIRFFLHPSGWIGPCHSDLLRAATSASSSPRRFRLNQGQKITSCNACTKYNTIILVHLLIHSSCGWNSRLMLKNMSFKTKTYGALHQPNLSLIG